MPLPTRSIARRTTADDSERGAVAVEFALISLLLFTLLFSVIQFGFFFSRYLVYSGAAREGARLAATRAAEADVVARVNDTAQPYDIDGTIAVSDQCDEDNVGDEVQVSWTQVFGDDNDDFAFSFIPFRVDIEMRGVFRCE